ncbi:MAG: SAM-dependent chlorinase/fluorinase [Anaerolineaceae bacterium]|nr:SAM-dependent chlorinase/fluorinase [Anaerolineaceae bacterium]
MKIITLTTDFGTGDFEIGTLSGVIWRIAPHARIVDLTHDIGRHNIRQAALMLERVTPFFPEGSIHIVVVDPGVGTHRRPLAARLGTQYFVGPDNGLLTRMLDLARADNQLVEIVTPNRREFWLPEVSNIFHGRDVFSPVAAHLAAGTPLQALGDTIDDPVLLHFPQPEPIPGGWRGEVLDIDYFGSLGTNIKVEHLRGSRALRVQIAGRCIEGLSRTFGEGKPGDLLALIDSSNELAVSVVNGSAERELQAKVGDEVIVTLLNSAENIK